MATRKELRTFRQIQDAIMNLLKYQSTDSVSRDRIKQDINMAYLEEVVPFKQWAWTRKSVNLQVQPYYATGTVSVTANSVAATLSEVLTTSKVGFKFSVTGFQEVYTIKSHTLATGAIILDQPFGGQTNATAGYKIWQNSIAAPADLAELIQLKHGHTIRPVEEKGLQEFGRIVQNNPKAEGRPQYCSVSEFKDPEPYTAITGLPTPSTRATSGLVKTIKFNASLGSSDAALLLKPGDRIQISGAGHYSYNIEAVVSSVTTSTLTNDTITYTALTPYTEAATADTSLVITKQNTQSFERYREILIYPSIYNARTTLELDYVRNAEALEADTDEPLIPLEHRAVLFYYGAAYAWSRERNSEESDRYRALADQRLARMSGFAEEDPDKPMVTPSKIYLATKRRSNRGRVRRSGSVDFGGGGSTTNPLGTPNSTAAYNAQGELASTSISTTELGSLEGIVGNVEARLNALGLDSETSVGSRVLVSDAATPPAITESTVSSSSVTYLLDAEGQTQVLLLDNTASATNVASWVAATYDSLFLVYSIKRGTAREAGMIQLTTDGTSAAIAQGSIASLGTTGVTLTADVSTGTLRLRYTTTSTGSDAVMKYRLIKWLA